MLNKTCEGWVFCPHVPKLVLVLGMLERAKVSTERYILHMSV